MAVIGAILGDIAGSIYEFYRPKDLDWEHCELFTKQNFYTDDTILTLACKLAILKDIPFSETYTTLAQYQNNYKWNSLCQESVPVAIRCFIESENYEGFLRNVLSLDCDADTIGTIGGGIAEEFYKGTGFNDDELLKQYLDNYLYELVQL